MNAKAVVRADALFEALLGSALIAGAADGGFGPTDFPRPVGTPLIVIAGCVLLVLAAVLWSGAIPISVLAIGNAVTGTLALAWLLAASGFSTAGTCLVAVTTGALVALAVAQGAIVRSRDSERRRLPLPHA